MIGVKRLEGSITSAASKLDCLGLVALAALAVAAVALVIAIAR